MKQRQEKNFIKDNLNKVVFEMKPSGRESAEGKARGANGSAAANEPQHKNYGKVPQYLNKYKQEREDALK